MKQRFASWCQSLQRISILCILAFPYTYIRIAHVMIVFALIFVFLYYVFHGVVDRVFDAVVEVDRWWRRARAALLRPIGQRLHRGRVRGGACLRDRILARVPDRVQSRAVVFVALAGFVVSFGLYQTAWRMLAVPMFRQPWYVYLGLLLQPIGLALFVAFGKGCVRYWGRYSGQRDARKKFAGAVLRDMVSSALSDGISSVMQMLLTGLAPTPVSGDFWSLLRSGYTSNYRSEQNDLAEQERARFEYLSALEQAERNEYLNSQLPEEAGWEVLLLFYCTGIGAWGTILVAVATALYALGVLLHFGDVPLIKEVGVYALGPGRWVREVLPLAFLRLGLEGAWLRSRLRKQCGENIRRDATMVVGGMLAKGPLVGIGSILSTSYADLFSVKYRLEEAHPLIPELVGKLVRDGVSRFWRSGSRLAGQILHEIAVRWREASRRGISRRVEQQQQ